MELKAIVVEDIKKEINAFANCEGGKLYIGVQDDGTVSGLDDLEGASLQGSNMVRDAIKPVFCLSRWMMFTILMTAKTNDEERADCSDGQRESYSLLSA